MASSFAFGATPSPAPAFGAPAAATPAAATPSTTFGFGSSTFGAAPAAAAPAASGFGGFGFTQQQQQQQQLQLQQQQQQLVAQAAAQDTGSASLREFQKLQSAYKHAEGDGKPNPDCRMKHVVYNQVDPALRNSYGRPSYMDDKTWKKAEEDNPDPTRLVPAAVIGWGSLCGRLKAQQDEMHKMERFVNMMKATTISGLSSVGTLQQRMEASRRRHLAQAHRFLKIQRKLDAVRCMNKPLHDAERQLRMRLEYVHRALGPPQQALKDLNSALLQGERQSEDVEEITNPETLKRIFQALEGQRDGLEHLMRIVKKDKQDMEIMTAPRMLTQ